MKMPLMMLGISLLLILAGMAESWLYRKRTQKIPLRILVNGTRGKTSTTRLLTTYSAALVVYGLVKLLARYLMEFGSRRYMASVLLGLLIHWAFLQLLPYLPRMTQDVRLIGFIIPGLIANDMYKQGVLKTTLTSLISAGLIWLILMLGRAI